MLQRAGKTVIRHGGGISGFRAEVAYYPDEELTIAVLANSEGLNTDRLSDQIAPGQTAPGETVSGDKNMILRCGP